MSRSDEKKDRRSHLKDFHQVGEDYVYTGAEYHDTEKDRPFARTQQIRIACCGAMTISALTAGCLPVAGMRNTFYVILPYVGTLTCVLWLTWILFRLFRRGNSLRAYVFEKTIGRVPGLSAGAMVCAALTAVGNGAALIRMGVGEFSPGWQVLFYLCLAVIFLSATVWKRLEHSVVWNC